MMNKIISLDKTAVNLEESMVKNSEKKNKGEDMTNNNEEQELANKFKLMSDQHKQPKDWLLHKNGAKNSVYKFEYPKNSQQVHEIILKLEEG